MSTLNQTGWVKWPRTNTGRFNDAGHGGLWVYAYWVAWQDLDEPDAASDDGLAMVLDADDDDDETSPDPFISCYGVEHTLALPVADTIVSDNASLIYPVRPLAPYAAPNGDQQLRQNYLEGIYDAGAPILAGVCLGSSPHALFDVEAQKFWHCTRSDLTWHGRRLLSRLDALYSRTAHLVTYLDAYAPSP